MNKTIICGIPMKEKIDSSVYVSDDKSIPTSSHAVSYPINSVIARTLKADDAIKFILLVKKDRFGHYAKNLEVFKKEFEAANKCVGAKFEYIVIDTEFSEKKAVHEQLMVSLVDQLDIGSHILVDMTYGPKDLPIVVFTALNFAEKFLDCQIDNIIYGKADFVDGKAVNTEICDMSPLYYLGSVTNTINSVEAEKAKAMLKLLLSV